MADKEVNYFFTQMRGAARNTDGSYRSRKFAKHVSTFLRLLRAGDKKKLHVFVKDYQKRGGE